MNSALVVAGVVILALLASTGQGVPTKGSSTLDDIHTALDSMDLSDDADARTLFSKWMNYHKKVYKTDENHKKAFNNVQQNAMKVKAHRKEAALNALTYQLALNKFADMDFNEFKDKYLGLQQTRDRGVAPPASPGKRAAPLLSVNYTALGYVTPVKNQGDCGCCWAFATTGMLEAAYYLTKKTLKSFSEESLVECVQGNIGCGGGDMETTLQYVAGMGGIVAESTYPYTAGDDVFGACVTTTYPKVSLTPTFTDLFTDSDIMNTLQTLPVQAAVSVNDAFMLYGSGVMNPSIMCGAPADINHAILITGYGVDPVTQTPYWLIKNSWDTDWGELGYFRVDRTSPDACGVAEYAIQVTVTAP